MKKLSQTRTQLSKHKNKKRNSFHFRKKYMTHPITNKVVSISTFIIKYVTFLKVVTTGENVSIFLNIVNFCINLKHI